MALKDWKTIRNYHTIIEFYSIKIHQRVYVEKINKILGRSESWVTYIPHGSETFSSRDKALKFAKSYMKTH